MAFKLFHEYGPDIEERMRSVFQTLGEKEKCRYAAVEAAGWLGSDGCETC